MGSLIPYLIPIPVIENGSTSCRQQIASNFVCYEATVLSATVVGKQIASKLVVVK